MKTLRELIDSGEDPQAAGKKILGWYLEEFFRQGGFKKYLKPLTQVQRHFELWADRLISQVSLRESHREGFQDETVVIEIIDEGNRLDQLELEAVRWIQGEVRNWIQNRGYSPSALLQLIKSLKDQK